MTVDTAALRGDAEQARRIFGADSMFGDSFDVAADEIDWLRKENAVLRNPGDNGLAFMLGRERDEARGEVERLRQENEELREEAHTRSEGEKGWRDAYEALRGENQRLRAALAFYADPETYHAIMFMADPPCGEFADDFSEDHGDPHYNRAMPGKHARDAIGGEA